MTDQPFHTLLPDEHEEVYAAAAGAYMGVMAARQGMTWSSSPVHHEAFHRAVEEAFNAGVAADLRHANESWLLGRTSAREVWGE